MRFQGTLYRALNPVWGADPLSGSGAALYGGRFNAKGMPALYCSLSPHTALREANQVGDLQPTMVVSYAADIDRVFDATAADRVAGYGMTLADLGDPGWREAMRDGEAPTQALARRLAQDGFRGMLVASFARGATAHDRNLVLWSWGEDLPTRLILVDDEGRLERAYSTA